MQRSSVHCKKILFAVLFYSTPVFLFAQNDFNIKNVSGFQDSGHHWMDITDHEQIIVLTKNQPRFTPDDVRQIVDNILLYQQPEYPEWLNKISQ